MREHNRMSQSNEDKPPFTPPRTPAKELITAIYGSLLGIENVSILDSFYDLGGSDEQAEKLAARLREVFRVEVHSSDLIACPTTDRLADTLARKSGGREIVDEIAWTSVLVDQLSDIEADSMLRSEVEFEWAGNHGVEWTIAESSVKRRRLVELLLEKTGITFRMRENGRDGKPGPDQ